MAHSKHVRLSAIEFNADTLEGATIFGPGDDKIGFVSHSWRRAERSGCDRCGRVPWYRR